MSVIAQALEERAAQDLARHSRRRSPYADIYEHAALALGADTLSAPALHLSDRRDPEQRAAYAGDPCRYVADILGFHPSPQQEAMFELIETEDRVLVPSGNNLGKTAGLSAYGVYVMDALAAIPDEHGRERGARLLLPGPDHSTIFATIYSEILEHLARAIRRGHPMPGRWSENSVLWRVRPMWEIEAFSPPKNVQQAVSHTTSGRHHANQVALIEEGQGVEERIWRATEGMCSSAGNKIVSAFNPTEPVGPAHQRHRDGVYRTIHLSALDHPNVRERRPVIPQAIGYRVIDARVKTGCRDRGPYPETEVEPDHLDFVYALPPADDTGEDGQREDGHLGHPRGELRVYRPDAGFIGQVLGRWPENADTSLFDPHALDGAMDRWKAGRDPVEPADRVGVDTAREGDDDAVAAPAWGETAAALMRGYIAAQDTGPATLEQFLASTRTRVGEFTVLSKGKGHEMAEQLVRIFGRVPMNLDEGGVGSSPLDHLRYVLKVQADGVSFGAASPLPPRMGFVRYCDNLRTWLYVTAAKVVALGLVDVPNDPLLREELIAHWLEPSSRTVEVFDDVRKITLKKRVPSVALCDKDAVKRKIGRSPDRADAFVLALFDPMTGVTSRKKKVQLAWGNRS